MYLSTKTRRKQRALLYNHYRSVHYNTLLHEYVPLTYSNPSLLILGHWLINEHVKRSQCKSLESRGYITPRNKCRGSPSLPPEEVPLVIAVHILASPWTNQNPTKMINDYFSAICVGLEKAEEKVAAMFNGLQLLFLHNLVQFLRHSWNIYTWSHVFAA